MMFVDLAKCRSGSTTLGKVVETMTKSSAALRTVWRRHENGFSITYLRRKFYHNGKRQIEGSSTWHAVRHIEFYSTVKQDIKVTF